jgi:hypothetical protein
MVIDKSAVSFGHKSEEIFYTLFSWHDSARSYSPSEIAAALLRPYFFEAVEYDIKNASSTPLAHPNLLVVTV